MECNPLLKIDAGFFKIRAPVPSKLAPEAPKIEVGDPRRAKMHPRGARDQPRGAQERPRGAREAPKSAQEMPKRRPRGTGRSPTPSKNEFRKIQNASRTHLGAFGEHVADPSSKKRSPKPLQTTFAWFFSMMAKSANLDFYRSCRCFRRFFKNACCSIDVGATRENRSKNLRRKPLKSSLDPPGTL